MIFFLLIWLVLLLFVSYLLSNRDLMAPAVVTSGIWIFMLLMFLILKHSLPPLNQVLLSIFLWTTCFVFAALLVQSLRFSVSSLGEKVPSVRIRDIYFLLSVFTYPLLLMFAYHAIKNGETGIWALDLRKAVVDSEGGPYGGLYLILWKVAYAIELTYYSRKNRLRFYVLLFLYVSMGILLMSKAVFLELALITIIILWYKGKIKMRHLLYSLAALCVLFITLQKMRHHLSSAEGAKNDFFVLYIIGHMSAFDTLEPCSASNFGENVFRIFYAVPYKLGFSEIKPVDTLLPWIEEPINTNTYTGFYPFFVDFGQKGVALFALIFGSLFGWLYKKRKRGGGQFFIILYALLFNGLIMQYVAELFLTNFAAYAYSVLLVMLPFVFTIKGNDKLVTNNNSSL